VIAAEAGGITGQTVYLGGVPMIGRRRKTAAWMHTSAAQPETLDRDNPQGRSAMP
jgi:hypothetical protein